MYSSPFGRILTGDARKILPSLPPSSVDLSFWSPPYYVGKSYEKNMTFKDWEILVSEVIACHEKIVKPGGFIAVNIGDILCFPDPNMPRFQADNVKGKRNPVTREAILQAKRDYPEASRYRLAELLGCSEQTIQRRLQGTNIRGGKHESATKVVLTGCLLADWAEEAGFYLYDQRIWHKDPCWANSRWHSTSYRAVDEFEHLYVFWKPGETTYDRDRISGQEWSQWGSRGVWNIRSVRRNDRHEAEFPEELARRVIMLFSPGGGGGNRSLCGNGNDYSGSEVVGSRMARYRFIQRVDHDCPKTYLCSLRILKSSNEQRSSWWYKPSEITCLKQ